MATLAEQASVGPLLGFQLLNALMERRCRRHLPIPNILDQTFIRHSINIASGRTNHVYCDGDHDMQAVYQLLIEERAAALITQDESLRVPLKRVAVRNQPMVMPLVGQIATNQAMTMKTSILNHLSNNSIGYVCRGIRQHLLHLVENGRLDRAHVNERHRELRKLLFSVDPAYTMPEQVGTWLRHPHAWRLARFIAACLPLTCMLVRLTQASNQELELLRDRIITDGNLRYLLDGRDDGVRQSALEAAMRLMWEAKVDLVQFGIIVHLLPRGRMTPIHIKLDNATLKQMKLLGEENLKVIELFDLGQFRLTNAQRNRIKWKQTFNKDGSANPPYLHVIFTSDGRSHRLTFGIGDDKYHGGGRQEEAQPMPAAQQPGNQQELLDIRHERYGTYDLTSVDPEAMRARVEASGQKQVTVDVGVLVPVCGTEGPEPDYMEKEVVFAHDVKSALRQPKEFGTRRVTEHHMRRLYHGKQFTKIELRVRQETGADHVFEELSHTTTTLEYLYVLMGNFRVVYDYMCSPTLRKCRARSNILRRTARDHVGLYFAGRLSTDKLNILPYNDGRRRAKLELQRQERRVMRELEAALRGPDQPAPMPPVMGVGDVSFPHFRGHHPMPTKALMESMKHFFLIIKFLEDNTSRSCMSCNGLTVDCRLYYKVCLHKKIMKNTTYRKHPKMHCLLDEQPIELASIKSVKQEAEWYSREKHAGRLYCRSSECEQRTVDHSVPVRVRWCTWCGKFFERDVQGCFNMFEVMEHYMDIGVRPWWNFRGVQLQ